MIDYGDATTWILDVHTMEVRFTARHDGNDVQCRVARRAIDDGFGKTASDSERLSLAQVNFDRITDAVGERIVRHRFEPDGTVLLRDWPRE